MRLTTIILIASLMQVSAAGLAQSLSLKTDKASLRSILKEVKKQTGYNVLIRSQEIRQARPITVNLIDVPLKDALNEILKGQQLEFSIEDNVVLIKERKKSFIQNLLNRLSSIDITGRVIDGSGNPLSGATVKIKTTNKAVITNANGQFIMENIEEGSILTISFTGYVTRELKASEQMGNITLETSFSKLDEVQVVAYGQNTSLRLTTGSIAKVSAADIAQHPVTNVLQALSGQVPGLLITQTSGTPGAGVAVQIRAANSLQSVDGAAAAGSNPLYIIDGVPFLSEPAYNAGGNTVGYLKPSFGNSPLNAINPTDIESIAILKDADATSIYGSRGANGVILITTKKGKSGKTKIDFNLSSGISDVANLHRVKTLTLDQYLEIRRKAFANSNATPTTANAPDLLVWDATKSTDFQKELIGKTAHATDASASFSGGSEYTNFLLSGAYHKETTVIPGGFNYNRGSIHFAAEHSSVDRKFSANVNATLVLDKNNNVARSGAVGDLGQAALTQAPNFPLYNADGSLYWYNQNVYTLAYDNPLRYTYQKYTAKNNNLVGGIMLKYTPVSGLNIKVNASYNKLLADSKNLLYSASYNPYTNTPPYATAMQNTAETWNIEPQIDYTLKISKGSLNLLAGGTIQDNKYVQPFYIVGNNYSSDALLGSISNAGSTTVYNFDSEYKYQSLLGRLNYNWLNKYLINVNFRYDGSSKFGENQRFGAFGSVGGAWILSEEKFLKDNLSFVSFAKLRSSYGTTGNDQIPNYLYFDTYQTTFNGYAGTKGLIPAKLANPDLKWEVTKKFEAAIDLGFLKDRILISASWFRNRTDNSLVSNPLSVVAGFSSYYGNLPAKKQQQGWEFTATTQNIRSTDFSWTTNFNISFAQSKLVAFPNIANTGYANSMLVGQSLSTIYGYKYTGISATTNLPTFLDANGNGVVSLYQPGLAVNGVGDYVPLGKTDPDFFGGVSNSLRYKNLQIDFLVQFTGHSTRYGIEYYTGSGAPGYNPVNMSSYAYDLFKATNGVIATRSPTAGTDNTAYDSYSKYMLSDAVLSNGAYLRLKNVAISYKFNDRLIRHAGLSAARVFLQGENLVTITNFKGYDPETPASNIPPLRTIVAGVNFSF